MRTEGNLHRVNCDGCGLKMACSCCTVEGRTHIVILCPKCQVEDFIETLFGGDDGGEPGDQKSSKPADKKPR
jgi:hypothetical protein